MLMYISQAGQALRQVFGVASHDNEMRAIILFDMIFEPRRD